MVAVAILPALIFLLLLGFAVVTLWRTLTLPRASARVPVCGSCAYPVADLTTFTCPECGQDLRAAGIRTPQGEARRRGSLAGACIAWTFVWVTLAYVGIQLVASTGVFTRTAPLQPGPISAVVMSPESGSFTRVTVSSTAQPGAHADPIDVTIDLPEGTSHSLHIDADDMWVSAPGRQSARWTTGVMGEWFGEIGLPVDDGTVAAEAASLGAFVDALIARRVPPSALPAPPGYSTGHVVHGGAGATTAMTFQRDRVAMGATYLGAFTLYIIGLVCIANRRRKLLRSIAHA